MAAVSSHRRDSRTCSFGEKKKPVGLTYNVSLEVQLAKGGKKGAPRTKVILRNVQGYAAPGNLLAVMGPSGSGKTSLLNCLSHRNSSYAGQVLLNGEPASSATTARLSGFVQQEDLFIPTLTPREHLQFAATMRMDRSVPAEAKRARVEALIADLGLGKCADTLIGGAGSSIRGISGGEKKRLSFAAEILGNPSLVFADEPTSGLDSYMAEMVVAKMRELARSGCTVITTIHQPSSAVFDYFTHLHLLGEGRTAYFGTTAGAIEHFASIGHPCPTLHNPADHYIRLMSGARSLIGGSPEHTDTTTANSSNNNNSSSGNNTAGDIPSPQDNALLQEVLTAYESSPAAAAAAARCAANSMHNQVSRHVSDYTNDAIQQQQQQQQQQHSAAADAVVCDSKEQSDIERGADESSTKQLARPASSGQPLQRRYCASWITQFWQLYKRTLLMYAREPILTRVRLGQAIFVAVIVGLIYLQVDKTQADVQGIMGVLFFAVLNQSMLGTIGVLQTFPLEMPIFLREHSAAMYRVDTYFLGRTMAELPFQFIYPAIYGTLIYWLVGLPADAGVFFLFILFILLTTNAAISLGYVISALSKSVSLALALGPVILLPLILFAGLLINVSAIPDYFKWLSVFSFIQYGYSGVSIAVWQEMGDLECPPAPQSCPYPTGKDVLDYLSFEPDDQWINIISLVILIVGFRCIALLALLYRARPGAKTGY